MTHLVFGDRLTWTVDEAYNGVNFSRGTYSLNIFVQWSRLGCAFLSALLVFLSVVESHLFPDIAAIVNGPVTLPCNCSGQVVKWTIIHPNQASIGVCQHGRCEIEQPFQKRFSIVGNTSTGNFSMSIGSAVYNDVGIYKCTCDGKSVSEGKVMVYGKSIEH